MHKCFQIYKTKRMPEPAQKSLYKSQSGEDCVYLHLHPASSRKSPYMELTTTSFKSNQIKSLLLSHHHSTSALVSEILMSVLQTVQKNNRQFTYGQTVQKNNKQFTYGQTVQKKQQTIYIWTDSAKKLHWSIYSAPDSAKNKNKK